MYEEWRNSCPSSQKHIPAFFVLWISGSREIPMGKKSKPSTADSSHNVDDNENHVQELLNYLNAENIISDDQANEDIDWRRALDKHVSSSSFKRLAKYVATERCEPHFDLICCIVFDVNIVRTHRSLCCLIFFYTENPNMLFTRHHKRPFLR